METQKQVLLGRLRLAERESRSWCQLAAAFYKLATGKAPVDGVPAKVMLAEVAAVGRKAKLYEDLMADVQVRKPASGGGGSDMLRGLTAAGIGSADEQEEDAVDEQEKQDGAATGEAAAAATETEPTAAEPTAAEATAAEAADRAAVDAASEPAAESEKE